MHPVPEVSRIEESHKDGDDVLTSGRLTTVLLAATRDHRRHGKSNLFAEELWSIGRCGNVQ